LHRSFAAKNAAQDDKLEWTWRSLKEIPRLAWFENDEVIVFSRRGQNREWFIPLRAVAVSDTKQNCDSYAHRCAEGDEIPQRGKADEEDRGATDGEEKAHESATDGEIMHGDAGMPIRSHGATSVLCQ
jgi:hypothetical protein